MAFDWIKQLSTHRLLNLFRRARASVNGRDPERPRNASDEEEDEVFDLLKQELDTREHVPRRPRKKAARPKLS